VAGFELGPDNKAIRRSVGILTETPGLYGDLTAWQNLLFFAGLYEVPEDRAGNQAERFLKMLDLWERRDDKVSGFSKGMRQKLALARALVHEPSVVFLDEPTAGLDPQAARTVHAFITEMRAEGRTVFLTTHNLNEADALCDLVAVFRTRLLAIDTPANLREHLFGKGTLVRVADAASQWEASVRALPFVKNVRASADTLNVSLDDPDSQNPALVQALVEAGAPVRYVQPAGGSLEQVYLDLVGEDEAATESQPPAPTAVAQG
jgi:ABC-2 type transport system ATP-binding protein